LPAPVYYECAGASPPAAERPARSGTLRPEGQRRVSLHIELRAANAARVIDSSFAGDQSADPLCTVHHAGLLNTTHVGVAPGPRNTHPGAAATDAAPCRIWGTPCVPGGQRSVGAYCTRNEPKEKVQRTILRRRTTAYATIGSAAAAAHRRHAPQLLAVTPLAGARPWRGSIVLPQPALHQQMFGPRQTAGVLVSGHTESVGHLMSIE
jgi:hypothetical protein